MRGEKLLLILVFLLFSSFLWGFDPQDVKKAQEGELDLRGADLSGANLQGVSLEGADFENANLMGVDFSGADLSGADFSGAKSVVGAKFNNADLTGANFEGASVLGCNFSGANLKNVTYKDWIKDVEDALFSLEKRVSSLFVTGLSMGGTLSLYLSEVYPKKIKGVIPINPAIFVHDKLIKFVPILKYIITSLPGIGSDVKKKDIIEPAYKRFPMASGYELYKLVNIVRKNLKDIVSPLLMMASQFDHLVPIEDKKYIYGHISSQIKDILILENSYHVATMDNDQDKIIKGIEGWIEKNK